MQGSMMNDEYRQHHHWLEIDSMQIIHLDAMKMGNFMQDDEEIYMMCLNK